MSLFEELFAKYKKEQDEEKNVPFVTCVCEAKNTNTSDYGNTSATDHPVKPGKVHARDPSSTTNFYVNSSTRAQVTFGTLSPDPIPGQCDQCPACGFWDAPKAGPGKYCFYEAYFLAKPARAILADNRKDTCPLKVMDGERK